MGWFVRVSRRKRAPCCRVDRDLSADVSESMLVDRSGHFATDLRGNSNKYK